MLETTSGELEAQLANLIHVSWVVLIPLGVLLSLVVYKILALLQSVYEFWAVARHELSPALTDLRKTAGHVEVITGRAAEGLETVERGVQATVPLLRQGVERLQNVRDKIQTGVMGLIQTIRGR